MFARIHSWTQAPSGTRYQHRDFHQVWRHILSCSCFGHPNCHHHQVDWDDWIDLEVKSCSTASSGYDIHLALSSLMIAISYSYSAILDLRLPLLNWCHSVWDQQSPDLEHHSLWTISDHQLDCKSFWRPVHRLCLNSLLSMIASSLPSSSDQLSYEVAFGQSSTRYQRSRLVKSLPSIVIRSKSLWHQLHVLHFCWEYYHHDFSLQRRS